MYPSAHNSIIRRPQRRRRPAVSRPDRSQRELTYRPDLIRPNPPHTAPGKDSVKRLIFRPALGGGGEGKKKLSTEPITNLQFSTMTTANGGNEPENWLIRACEVRTSRQSRPAGLSKEDERFVKVFRNAPRPAVPLFVHICNALFLLVFRSVSVLNLSRTVVLNKSNLWTIMGGRFIAAGAEGKSTRKQQTSRLARRWFLMQFAKFLLFPTVAKYRSSRSVGFFYFIYRSNATHVEYFAACWGNFLLRRVVNLRCSFIENVLFIVGN